MSMFRRAVLGLALFVVSIYPAAAQVPALEPITTENASQLVEIARIGRGSAHEAEYSPDGQQLMVATSMGVWRYQPDNLAADPTLLFSSPSLILQMAFSPTGETLALSSADNMVRIIDAASGQELHHITLTSVANSIGFSPDGARLVITQAGSDTALVWDMALRQTVMTLVDGENDLYFAVYSPDGAQIITAGFDAATTIWDAETGDKIIDLASETADTEAIFSPDGALIAVLEKQAITLWDSANHQALRTITLDSDSYWSGLQFSPNSEQFIASVGNRVQVWDVATGEFLREFSYPTNIKNIVTDTAFSPDGQTLIVTSYYGGVQLQSLQTGQVNTLTGYMRHAYSVAISPDASRLAYGTGNGQVKITQPDTLTNTMLGEHGALVASVAFSPDGQQLASAGWDNLVKIWDVTNTETPIIFNKHTGFVLSVAFSPDGKRVISASQDGTALVWDVATQEVILTLAPEWGVTNAEFSPDGMTIVTASLDTIVRLWDATTGEQLRTYGGLNSAVNDVDFSADGSRLVAITINGGGLVWDVESEEVLREFIGSGNMAMVALSPDGSIAASTGDEGRVHLWEIASGSASQTPLHVLSAHPSFVYDITFSPDGTWIATASQDGTVRLWGVLAEQ